MEDIKVNNKITVLGKTFNSEEERRNYFREELRKKLPELKQMEGFPIGEDEDILNLSDPPYYTACPNPWLNDFVAEWEEEKKDLEKEGKRVADFEVDEPYAADVSEGKNNPIYNAHSYHTKVPHPAIMRYILHYTQPGDIVFDGFAGTGMTGVAASKCGHPKSVLELTNSDYKIGLRKAIVGDLAPYAYHISSVLNGTFDLFEFKKMSNDILDKVKLKYGWMFHTMVDGVKSEIIYSVLSERIVCNECSQDFSYWESAVDFENAKVKSDYLCPICSASNSNKSSLKYYETTYDPIVQESRTIRPYDYKLISYKSRNGRGLKTKIDQSDKDRFHKIEEVYNSLGVKSVSFLNSGKEWGDTWRKGIHSDIEYVHDFYTKTNFIIINEIFKEINEVKDFKTKEILKFWFTASQSRLHKMNRYAPQHKRHVGPMANTYYISPLPTEISPFYFFKEKQKNILNVKELRNRNVSIVSSATSINLENDSVDYIFTDPPFGANIMYSELNFIYEYWLNIYTNNNAEAIESKSQNKSIFEYQHLMIRSFMEFNRLLKPGKWMTVEFSNTSAGIWNAIQNSLQRAGFIVSNVSAINKGRGGMQAIIGPKAVNQDLVISCYKPSSEFDQKFKQHQNTDVAVWDFVEEHLKHLPIHLVKDNATTAIIERSPKILFDRLIAFYVQKGLPVPIDAGAFQKGLRERFIERDGMFFTNEQIQEYDKKKVENPEFIQLSILVSSEQDGVLWLKNVLTEKSLAYQDIQPLWMQALAGVRKGDVIPELADILEENFLKDAQGKWYVPDPENEADLEKLRTKRLLKQFEVYKTEAAKPKGKIKEVRVEALSAGFKQSYQDKDFKTIVQVGDRIPNNLLMEDEVLLQFYDIASSRV